MNVYLDYAATSPLRAEVLGRMLPLLKENFGNPDSLHAFGRKAAYLVGEARDRIAGALGVKPKEVYFTSGGTEADNWAVRCLAAGEPFAVSSIEHAAVLSSAKLRGEHALLACDREGRVPLQAVEEALKSGAKLVALMAVNNETGVFQPVQEAAELCHGYGALLFADCVQAGRCCDLKALTAAADAVALSAHKLGGPKGTGLLWVRSGVRIPPLIAGGEQERSLRGGTLNAAGIVGMAEALVLAQSEREAFILHTKALREAFEARILSALGGEARIDGGGVAAGGGAAVGAAAVGEKSTKRAPNLSHITFAGGGEWLIGALDLRGVACSGGAACSAHAALPSHVMLAMGRSEEEAKRGVRFSFGMETTPREAEYAAETVVSVIRKEG